MSNINDFIVENGVLIKYVGEEENVIIPDGVKKIGDECFVGTTVKRVTIPESVNEIGDYAFVTDEWSHQNHIESIEIPKSVKNIGVSICAGVKDITIFDSIDPNSKLAKDWYDDLNGVWNSSVGCIGIYQRKLYTKAACNSVVYKHTITVKSSEDDSIKYKVFMCDDEESRRSYCAMVSSWGKKADFDFQRFDTKIFSLFKNFDNKLINAYYRLHYKYNLSDENEKKYRTWFKKNGAKVLSKLAEWGSIEMLAEVVSYDIITVNNIDKAIELATEKKQTELIAFLIDYKYKYFSSEELEKAEIKRLNKAWQVPTEPKIDWRKEFTVKRVEGGSVITKYKGTSLDITIPDVISGRKIVAIGDEAFSSKSYNLTSSEYTVRKKLKLVTIPDSVTDIGKEAFYCCYKLTSVKLPKNLVNIGKRAFNHCSSLSVLELPNSVKNIGAHAFNGCENLSSVTISQGVERIEDSAFYSCASLESIKIPESVVSIDRCAFCFCYSLGDIFIPDTVTSIGEQAFGGCKNLTIHAPAGSFAEQYAKDNKINFIAE